MLRLIPVHERADHKCAACGETRSVKYIVDLFDGDGNTLGEVSLCNKCALLYMASNDKKEDK